MFGGGGGGGFGGGGFGGGGGPLLDREARKLLAFVTVWLLGLHFRRWREQTRLSYEDADTFDFQALYNPNFTDIFPEDPGRWRNFYDLTKAQILNEVDQRLLVDEIKFLPLGSGYDAWQALMHALGDAAGCGDAGGCRSVPGVAEPEGVAYVGAAVQQAFADARSNAQKSQAHAKAMRQDALESMDTADATQDATQGLDETLRAEHAAISDLARRARDDEAKADVEAKHLADLMRQAEIDAAKANEDAKKAEKSAEDHQNVANHKQSVAELGKAQWNGIRRPTKVQFGAAELDVAKKLARSKAKQAIAQKAVAKAERLQARWQKIQAAIQRVDPSDAQAKVDDANRLQAALMHWRRRLFFLSVLVDSPQPEVSKVRGLEAKYDSEAHQSLLQGLVARFTAVKDKLTVEYNHKEKVAKSALQELKPLQDALDMHVDGAGFAGAGYGSGGDGAQVMRLDRPGIQAALTGAKEEAAKAWQRATDAQADAAQAASDADAAQQLVKNMVASSDMPTPEELDDEANNARAEALKAKATADALKAVAANAASKAKNARARSAQADSDLKDLQEHTRTVHAALHEAYNKRFNAAPGGVVTELGPATGKLYYIFPNGTITWTPPAYGVGGAGGAGGYGGASARYGEPGAEAQDEDARAAATFAEANKKLDAAKRIEAEATRLDWLLGALEHAMRERYMLDTMVGEVSLGANAAAEETEHTSKPEAGPSVNMNQSSAV